MFYVEGLVTYVGEGYFYLRVGKDTEIKVRCKDCTVREGQIGTFKLVVKKYRGQLLFFQEADTKNVE